jgi:hypothetical protein
MALNLAELALRLSESQGRRVRNPESGLSLAPSPVSELLASYEFPNPFPGEVGVTTARGIASFRALQAIYQAHRIISLGGPNGRVLEIGAGLGRTAFYAWSFGIRDYSIVDLPMSGVAQGYFLGRTLGPDAVCLFGENRPGVRILPPSAFLEATDRYDIVANVDSLTEIGVEFVRAYCSAIRKRAGVFLSINHETNPFTVREVCGELGMLPSSRAPYWMRSGYVEEIYRPPTEYRQPTE